MTDATAMTARERFGAILEFKPFDRLPIYEWAPWWDKTIERWHSEGLEVNLKLEEEEYSKKIQSHLGLDVCFCNNWIPSTAPGCPEPPSHGAPMIHDMADYERIKPLLYKDWIGPFWDDWSVRHGRNEIVTQLAMEGFFWFPRRLIGIENHLYAFCDQPELIHRINCDLCDYQISRIKAVCEHCTPDMMSFAEDMSYNHGPMLSKNTFDEFLKPYYLRVIAELDKRDILPMVDSDGDVSELSYWLEEVGVRGIYPLERQAGCDIARLRQEHPRMVFLGHYDKMCMSKGEEAMRTEFERLLPTAAKGGFIISVDHQTPPEVSLENYRTYVRLFNEYAVRAGEMSRS